jgi:hypothetical protein
VSASAPIADFGDIAWFVGDGMLIVAWKPTTAELRYGGKVASGTDNHAINLGVRITW